MGVVPVAGAVVVELPLVAVMPVPVEPVAAVSVAVMLPVVPVSVVSVVLVVAVLPVAIVSVPVVIVVAVAAVSVFVFVSRLQPNAKTANAARARIVRTSDFFIAASSLAEGNGGVIFRKSEGMSSRPLQHVVIPERFGVASFDGTAIYYDLYHAPSRSAVLIVPGFWRDRRHPSMVSFATRLASAGYRTAVVDVRGHGDSEGTYGFNFQEHHDVDAVARDLLRHAAVESIALVGLSYGGAIAVSAAARHDLPLASLLLISPVADPRMIVPRINPFTIHRHIAWSQALRRPRFAWRTRKLRALDDIGNVRVPVCFIHVKNDWLIAHRHSIALYERANEPKELHILDVAGNYHADRIFAVASESVEPIIDSFLERWG